MISFFLTFLIQTALAKADLAQIQKDLCATPNFSEDFKTEGDGICLDCIYGTQGAPAIPQGLKDVDLKIKLEALQSQRDREEFEFFQLIESRNFFKSITESSEDIDFIEEHLKALQKNKSKQVADYETLNSKGDFKLKLQEQSDSFKETGKAPLEYLQKVKSKLQSNMDRESAALDTLAVSVNSTPEQLDAHRQQKQTLENYREALQIFGKAKGSVTNHAILEAIEDYEVDAFDGVPSASQLETVKENIGTYDREIKKWSDRLNALKQKFIERSDSKLALNGKERQQLDRYRKDAINSLEGAKKNQGFRECGMSTAELVAVFYYTSTGYKFLNQALWSGGQDAKYVASFKTVLNRALSKLKTYQGSVIRGVTLPASSAREHQPGRIVNYDAFTSSSIDKGFEGDHQFVIRSKTGRYIGSYSSDYDENEILFPSDVKFKVLDRSGNKIILEEVAR